ncbi:helix-turn-helix domain-containing protein [Hoeflea sp. YIM 152468]|uniref:helix-turn-helix domain-containing protein n=1 Tax=Hoeflea sp. YIM 152468 TaxID=3031759 RepID=UPI0023DA0843|nr:helix-turn-helix domain-containing protein [Hoeflea sp. YIM 152468]MDF1607301.1 helix-turn-helix domain-containing protein [Hoeflea sp. YIM 152468]
MTSHHAQFITTIPQAGPLGSAAAIKPGGDWAVCPEPAAARQSSGAAMLAAPASPCPCPRRSVRLAGCTALSAGIPAQRSGVNRTAPGHCSNCVNLHRCRVVWRLVRELFTAACDRDLPDGTARRRPHCHMRQIAMYLSHVVLSVPYQTIARAFDRDRSTVSHACSVIEDRRDDPGYDRFVERCERCIIAVFAPLGADHADV